MDFKFVLNNNHDIDNERIFLDKNEKAECTKIYKDNLAQLSY